jgi:hypothetical protein
MKRSMSPWERMVEKLAKREAAREARERRARASKPRQVPAYVEEAELRAGWETQP